MPLLVTGRAGEGTPVPCQTREGLCVSTGDVSVRDLFRHVGWFCGLVGGPGCCSASLRAQDDPQPGATRPPVSIGLRSRRLH